MEQAEHHNLPLGIIVNRCVATTKARAMPIILINTTILNIWLYEALLAAELYPVEYHHIEHRANMERKGDDPRLNTKATDFDFEAEILHLSFKVNLVDEMNMIHVQHGQSIDLIYNHPEVFSLHNEHLRFCDHIRHTIPTSMDRPVYLLHCTIPLTLLGEVHKCLDSWLQQGIIQPSQSPYTYPGGDSVKKNWGNSFLHGLP